MEHKTLNNLPPEIINKSLEQKQAYILAFNKALERGCTVEECLFSANSASKLIAKMSNSVGRKDYTTKQAPLPSHIPRMEDVVQYRENEIKKALELEEAKRIIIPTELGKGLPQGVSRNVIAADFDRHDSFVIVFDTGEKLTSKPINIKQYVENYVGVITKNILTGSGVYSVYKRELSGYTFTIYANEHNLASPANVTVRDSSGKEKQCAITINPNGTVTIESNILLDSHIAVLT